MKSKSTILAVALTAISFSGFATQDTATVGVNGGFTTSCQIINAPASISFADMTVGTIAKAQITVEVECAIADIADYPTITIQSVSVPEIEGVIRFANGDRTIVNSAALLENAPITRVPSTTGVQTFTFQPWAHVQGTALGTAAPTPSDFTTSIDIQLSITN